MLESLNWMPIKDRADFHRLCLMYKCINCLTPGYVSDKLTTVSNIHNHNTCSSSRNDMPTVKPKNNPQMTTFKYIGAKSWNNTDPVIRDKSSHIALRVLISRSILINIDFKCCWQFVIVYKVNFVFCLMSFMSRPLWKSNCCLNVLPTLNKDV